MGENGGGEVKEKGGSGGTEEKGVRLIFKKNLKRHMNCGLD